MRKMAGKGTIDRYREGEFYRMTMTTSGRDPASFTVILPTYNEVQNIRSMVEELLRLYPGISVLVVDDNSVDGTVEAVQELGRRHPTVRLMVRDPRDRGLTASLMDGIANAGTEHFIVMDADFQHPPAVVGDVIEMLSAGHVLVVGTRNDIKAMKATRRLASWGANFIARSYLFVHRKCRPRDLMSGFFGGDAAVWKNVIQKSWGGFERQGFKILFDLMKFAPPGTRVSEVRYDFGERSGGESKLDSRAILSLLRQCGIPGKVLAALIGPFTRRPARRAPDQEAATTVRP